MTPETLLGLFDRFAFVILFAIGFVWKYVPAFKKLTNDVIPWLNAALFILAKLVAVPAQAALSPAAGQAALGITDVLFGAFVHSVLARQLYEGFGRALFEKVLRLKKPV